MAVTQKTILLNDFGLARRERTTSRGTSVRYTVSIEAEPLVHVFDAKRLGAGPANAIAEHLRTRMQSIAATAAPATILRRKYAKSALERGAPWAMRRYGGGRTGVKPPRDSDRLFNDSGRFAESIVARATRDNQWVINVAANRLDPSTFRDGEQGLARMYDQLRQYVPEFGDPAALARVPAVQRAIGESVDQIFERALGRMYAEREALRAQVRANQLSALRQVLSLAQQLAT